MITLSSEQLPHATAKSLRVLGKIRQAAEDFQVEEIPAYAPEGRGDHLFVHFRKTDLSTPEAVLRIAQALAVDADQAGFAGLKDKHAVTRQWLSVPGHEAAATATMPASRRVALTRHNQPFIARLYRRPRTQRCSQGSCRTHRSRAPPPPSPPTDRSPTAR